MEKRSIYEKKTINNIKNPLITLDDSLFRKPSSFLKRMEINNRIIKGE